MTNEEGQAKRLDEQVGAILRRAREKSGMGLREAAREMGADGISPSFLSSVETGGARASERVCDFYARAFGLPAEALQTAAGNVPIAVRRSALSRIKALDR